MILEPKNGDRSKEALPNSKEIKKANESLDYLIGSQLQRKTKTEIITTDNKYFLGYCLSNQFTKGFAGITPVATIQTMVMDIFRQSKKTCYKKLDKEGNEHEVERLSLEDGSVASIENLILNLRNLDIEPENIIAIIHDMNINFIQGSFLCTQAAYWKVDQYALDISHGIKAQEERYEVDAGKNIFEFKYDPDKKNFDMTWVRKDRIQKKKSGDYIDLTGRSQTRRLKLNEGKIEKVSLLNSISTTIERSVTLENSSDDELSKLEQVIKNIANKKSDADRILSSDIKRLSSTTRISNTEDSKDLNDLIEINGIVNCHKTSLSEELQKSVKEKINSLRSYFEESLYLNPEESSCIYEKVDKDELRSTYLSEFLNKISTIPDDEFDAYKDKLIFNKKFMKNITDQYEQYYIKDLNRESKIDSSKPIKSTVEKFKFTLNRLKIIYNDALYKYITESKNPDECKKLLEEEIRLNDCKDILHTIKLIQKKHTGFELDAKYQKEFYRKAMSYVGQKSLSFNDKIDIYKKYLKIFTLPERRYKVFKSILEQDDADKIMQNEEIMNDGLYEDTSFKNALKTAKKTKTLDQILPDMNDDFKIALEKEAKSHFIQDFIAEFSSNMSDGLYTYDYKKFSMEHKEVNGQYNVRLQKDILNKYKNNKGINKESSQDQINKELTNYLKEQKGIYKSENTLYIPSILFGIETTSVVQRDQLANAYVIAHVKDGKVDTISVRSAHPASLSERADHDSRVKDNINLLNELHEKANNLLSKETSLVHESLKDLHIGLRLPTPGVKVQDTHNMHIEREYANKNENYLVINFPVNSIMRGPLYYLSSCFTGLQNELNISQDYNNKAREVLLFKLNKFLYSDNKKVRENAKSFIKLILEDDLLSIEKPDKGYMNIKKAALFHYYAEVLGIKTSVSCNSGKDRAGIESIMMDCLREERKPSFESFNKDSFKEKVGKLLVNNNVHQNISSQNVFGTTFGIKGISGVLPDDILKESQKEIAKNYKIFRLNKPRFSFKTKKDFFKSYDESLQQYIVNNEYLVLSKSKFKTLVEDKRLELIDVTEVDNEKERSKVASKVIESAHKIAGLNSKVQNKKSKFSHGWILTDTKSSWKNFVSSWKPSSGLRAVIVAVIGSTLQLLLSVVSGLLYRWPKSAFKKFQASSKDKSAEKLGSSSSRLIPPVSKFDFDKFCKSKKESQVHEQICYKKVFDDDENFYKVKCFNSKNKKICDVLNSKDSLKDVIGTASIDSGELQPAIFLDGECDSAHNDFTRNLQTVMSEVGLKDCKGFNIDVNIENEADKEKLLSMLQKIMDTLSDEQEENVTLNIKGKYGTANKEQLNKEIRSTREKNDRDKRKDRRKSKTKKRR